MSKQCHKKPVQLVIRPVNDEDDGFKEDSDYVLELGPQIRDAFASEEGWQQIAAFQLDVDEVMAVVCDIRGPTGKQFVVTRTQSGMPPYGRATITFSLAAWSDTHPPIESQQVILSNVQLFEKGWRARSARPVPFHDSILARKKEVSRK